jgi:hypothetical protein
MTESTTESVAGPVSEAPAEAPEKAAGSKGMAGRPPYVPKKSDHEKVRLLRAMGIPINSIWKMLGISQHTFDMHFREDLHMGRDVIKAESYAFLLASAKKGNVTAIREMNRIMEKADIAESAERFLGETDGEEEVKPKEPKLGKKAAALIAAKNPDQNTPIGRIMARRAALKIVA